MKTWRTQPFRAFGRAWFTMNTKPSPSLPLSRRVGGIGPMPADVMILSDYPGFDEIRTGVPFSGRTGRELKRWCNGYELPEWDSLYVANVLKHAPLKKAVSAEEIARDEDDLIAELLAVRPRFVIALGRLAIRWMLGPVNVETVHGIPHTVAKHPKTGGKYYVLPGFNPAAGLRDTDLAGKVAYDLQQATMALKGRLGLASPVDAVPDPRYTEHLPPIIGPWIATDTESVGFDGPPWGLSLSHEPGRAYVATTQNQAALARAREALESTDLVVMHNSLHDIPVYRKMGIEIRPGHFTDTMVMAYLLCIEPQGLKDLAMRLAGMKMQDYADVLSDASKRLMRWYLEEIEADLDHSTLGLEKTEFNKWIKTIERIKAIEDPTEQRQKWRNSDVARRIVVRVGRVPPEATLDDVPRPRAVRYSGRDADATGRVYPILDERIDAMGLRRILDVDLGAMPMYERMQWIGMKIDPDHYVKMSGQLVRAMADIREEIDRIAGWQVNPNSGDQVAKLLFDQLHLPVLKWTDSKKRPSTDDKVLEALEGIHPIIELVRDDREASKMFSAFTDKVPGFADEHNRIHSHFRVTRTATGRPATSDPNVLALPKHSEWGKLFRKGFIPERGHRLGSWDLNQIELRVLAHESRDAEMVRIYRAGRDIHAERAYQLFGIRPEDQDESLHRLPTKKINFGIIMGMTEVGLAEQMRINKVPYDEADCRKFIDDTFKTWPGAKAWIEGKKNEARRYGYVRDMGGRIRYLPGVHSPLRGVCSEAERQSHATPVQSGAQYIMKRWMAMVWEGLQELWKDEVWVEPLLQIHDDLFLEGDEWAMYHKGVVDTMMRETLSLMQGFRVPITLKAVFGDNWGSMK